MTDPSRRPPALQGTLIDDDTLLDLDALVRACRLSVVEVETWVAEGVVAPRGAAREEWRFDGYALRRLRTAVRLARDLELNPPGVALALELLDEIAALRAELTRR